MKKRFTDADIRNLKTDKRLQDQLEGDGFGIRVYGTGAKVFFYAYTFDGKRRFLNLGAYDPKFETIGLDGKKIGSLAYHRQKYVEAKNKLNKGIDPLLEKDMEKAERKRTPFVSDFIDEFIKSYAKKKTRGWKETERALKAELLLAWKNRKMNDIKRRDLTLLLDDIADRGAPVMANRLLAYTRKMFSYAVQRDVIEINPFSGMERPNTEKSRERFLTEQEIKTLWENLPSAVMSDPIRNALKLILITGQRPGEVIGLHRREIDEAGRWWTIPEQRSKNKLAHKVYLTDLAQEIIGEKDGYIFESPQRTEVIGNAEPIPSSYEVRTMTYCIKKSLPHTPESQVVDILKVAHFTPHDLRRTVTTCMASMGIAGDVIDRVQNHISEQKKGVRHVYDRYDYAKEKQQALEAWSRKLTSIITGEASGKVIRMQGRVKKTG